MKLKFTKMHGAGNDFVVLDAIRTPIELAPDALRALADRHFGIGADQILIVGPPPADQPDIDFTYRIFNADGGEVEQCGNGARAFVRFVHEHGLSVKRALRVSTLAGVIEPQLESDDQVTVDMGPPRLVPAEVPFTDSGLVPRREGDLDLYPVDVLGQVREIAVVSMGNPHAVQRVADVSRAPVALEGPALENHPRFPRRVNAGFMEVVDRHTLRLRVWERGAGETLACGTGACAAAVAALRAGWVDAPVLIHTRGGDLTIDWSAPGASVRMTGPALTVFEGEVDLSALLSPH